MGTLGEHAIRNNYKGACQALDGQLANLSQGDVKGRLILAVNAALLASNVPTVGLRDDPSSGANALPRSATLRAVVPHGASGGLDRAYERYERTRAAGDKTALTTAFTTWYGPKGGSTIRNQLDDDGVGVVDQLKSFLGA